MPFIPHTEDDERAMLEAIGVGSIEDLFDEIPTELRSNKLSRIPAAIGEMELLREMASRARQDETRLSFIGAGAYEHHIPSPVLDLISRGEFLTAYTPYQSEASQGTLQVTYEYQSMMAHLTAMDVSNASVYDGATALAEAILMAVRANRKSHARKILLASNINPFYRSTCESIVSNQQIELVDIPYADNDGLTQVESLGPFADEDITALVISYPNFFGGLDAVNELTDWAHSIGALVIASVNPTALGVLRPPGEWGDAGADITVGEGQPLGVPLASGGPYFGFMCCRQNLVRQLPGRIIGRTVDLDGDEGFTLTLQAREQHIRRAKATSNICTNQGLLAIAATVYLSLLGAKGLRAVAQTCHERTAALLSKVTAIDGVTPRFDGPFFHEVVIRLPQPAGQVLEEMAKEGILAGYDLGRSCEGLEDCMLTNVTETKSDQDLNDFSDCLAASLSALGQSTAPGRN